jgi:hypothetical protein
MATFSDGEEGILARWERMLAAAASGTGWAGEYGRWSDNWALDWNRFHHFLWLLQCYDYFSQKGHNVSFPPANKNEAMPDLLIKRAGQKDVYAECYFYSKWWPQLEFLEYVLRKIDSNLKIRLTHNIGRGPESSLFNRGNFANTLANVATNLTRSKIAELRELAKQIYPQEVCKFGDVIVELEGEGEYQPSLNAHGDPDYSWPVFFKELAESKNNSNNLENCRPNIVMANGLGLDYQLSFQAAPNGVEIPNSIDEIWVAKCGVNESLGNAIENGRLHQTLRSGYSGALLL